MKKLKPAYRTKKEFIAAVAKEVEHLKVHATIEERCRLDFDVLNVHSKYNCIYGQMTGNCFSDRSRELYGHCLSRIAGEGDTFTRIKNELTVDKVDRGDSFSPLEVYIPMKGAKNAHIIAYLRDEVDTLKL